jgi:sodium-dependent phosphate transporter
MLLPLGVCCRTIILRRKNSTEWAFWSLPVLAFITVFINIFFVLVRGHLA